LGAIFEKTASSSYTMGKYVNGLLHVLMSDKNMVHLAFKIIGKAIPH
jgi:hypothetical protein